MFRGIQIRVLNQSTNFVSFVLTSSNSKRRMKKKEFFKRVKNGTYEVQNLKSHRMA
ncbi:MAG: hypothetical protein R3275_09620 [Saprospiraceae bacterium]|nr:hypothetical protein [Saprospiraceae bacterium]